MVTAMPWFRRRRAEIKVVLGLPTLSLLGVISLLNPAAVSEG